MISIQNDNSIHREEESPKADTGNASNPTPQNNQQDPENTNQLLNEKAEKYLRESGNIEDMPDEQDWQEANKTIEKNNSE